MIRNIDVTIFSMGATDTVIVYLWGIAAVVVVVAVQTATMTSTAKVLRSIATRRIRL